MVIFAHLIGPKVPQIFDPLISTDDGEVNNFTLCVRRHPFFLYTLWSISLSAV